jgi:hypothetical protein
MPQPTSPKSNPKPLPPWEKVLAAGARLQEILPGAVLVGGTSASLHARHPLSRDADHVLKNLNTNFDKVLAQLESVAGWQTTRINRPVLILGSLDGTETGIRQLIRTAPTRNHYPDGERPQNPDTDQRRDLENQIFRRNPT